MARSHLRGGRRHHLHQGSSTLKKTCLYGLRGIRSMLLRLLLLVRGRGQTTAGPNPGTNEAASAGGAAEKQKKDAKGQETEWDNMVVRSSHNNSYRRCPVPAPENYVHGYGLDCLHFYRRCIIRRWAKGYPRVALARVPIVQAQPERE